MNPVRLHHIRVLVDVDEQKRKGTEVILLRQRGKHSGKGADVIGTVVRRQRNAQQNQGNVCLFQTDDHLLEILFGGFDRDTSKAIIAAEFQEDQSGMGGENVIDTREAIGGGVAAHALILDAILVAVLIKKILQIVGIAGPRNAGSKAIPEGDDDRTIIGRSLGRGWGGGGT